MSDDPIVVDRISMQELRDMPDDERRRRLADLARPRTPPDVKVALDNLAAAGREIIAAPDDAPKEIDLAGIRHLLVREIEQGLEIRGRIMSVETLLMETQTKLAEQKSRADWTRFWALVAGMAAYIAIFLAM